MTDIAPANDSRRDDEPAQAAPAQARKLRVWDLPTRLFHWLVVAMVVAAWLIVDDEGWRLTVHTAAGYGVLAAVVFRLGWGFVGSTHARFSDFVRPWSAVRDYARQVARREPPRYIGHNPLGGWSVVVLLVTLTAIVASGLSIGNMGGEAVGPLARLVPAYLARAAKEVHESLWTFLQLLILVHLAGVATHWLLKGENLVRAMVTGDKDLTGDALGSAGTIAPLWRAIVVAGIAGGAVWAVMLLP